VKRKRLFESIYTDHSKKLSKEQFSKLKSMVKNRSNAVIRASRNLKRKLFEESRQ